MQKMLRMTIAGGVAFAWLWACAAAHATFTTWTLSNIAFGDNATATGFFTYDPVAVMPVSDFDIKVTAGRSPAFDYTPANSSIAAVGIDQQPFISQVVGPNPTVDTYRVVDFIFGPQGLPAHPSLGDVFTLVAVTDGFPTSTRMTDLASPGQLVAVPEIPKLAFLAAGLLLLLVGTVHRKRIFTFSDLDSRTCRGSDLDS